MYSSFRSRWVLPEVTVSERRSSKWWDAYEQDRHTSVPACSTPVSSSGLVCCRVLGRGVLLVVRPSSTSYPKKQEI